MEGNARAAAAMIVICFLAHADAAVLLVDDLTDGRSKASTGTGQLIAGKGWTPNGSGLGYNIGRLVRTGGVQIWVSNFYPPMQCTVEKQHYFAVRTTSQDYIRSSGRTGCCAKSSDQPNCQLDLADWAGWRTGTTYGNAYKILGNERGDDSECKFETKLSATFDASRVTTFKITWADRVVSFYHNSRKVGQSGTLRTFEIGWTFLGRDLYHGLPAINGPFYRKVVAWEGTEPANLESIGESTTAVSIARFTAASANTRTNGAERQYTLTGELIGARHFPQSAVSSSLSSSIQANRSFIFAGGN